MTNLLYASLSIALDLSLTSVYVFTSLSLKLARLIRLIDTSSHSTSSHHVYSSAHSARRDPKCHSDECERSIDRRRSSTKVRRAPRRDAVLENRAFLDSRDSTLEISARRGGEPANQLCLSDVSCSARLPAAFLSRSCGLRPLSISGRSRACRFSYGAA
jgi:hypothetical protein